MTIELNLAFSCKRRHFCAFCHQKRVVEFGEWLCEQVLKAVPHRHFIFSIPKILRRYFLYDRRLLSELSHCAWKSLKAFLQITGPEQAATPGAVTAIQPFGDFLISIRRINPHCHVLCIDGTFYGSGSFKVATASDTAPLEKIRAAARVNFLRHLQLRDCKGQSTNLEDDRPYLALQVAPPSRPEWYCTRGTI